MGVAIAAAAHSAAPAWVARHRVWLLLGAAILIVLSETSLLAERGVVPAAVDAAAGTALLAVGVAAAARPAMTRLAVVASLAGLAWFVANLADPLVYLHRPLLVHAVLGYPDGRLRGPLAGLTVGFASLGAFVLPVGADASATAVLGVLVVLAAVVAAARAPLLRRPASRVAVGSAVVLGAAIAAPALLRLTQPVSPAAEVVAVAQAGLVAAVGGILLAAVLLRTGSPSGLADAVVELSEVGSPRLDALVASLRSGADHAADADGDPATFAVLSTVAELLDDNIQLHAALEAQVEDVRRSRRRLVDVVDAERRRLRGRLAAGPHRHLDRLDAALSGMRAVPDDGVQALVRQAEQEVAAARDDLARLGHGMPPTQLAERGLAPALRDLAKRQPVATTVQVTVDRLPMTVEATAWYVCAEAAANVAKHARARSMTIAVARRGGEVAVTVADDGAGGARMVPGGGLAGLADRVDALGGRLEVCDRSGVGTRLEARIPWT